MRIATYNVNGINGRLANLLGWLRVTAPDIVCLQELKAPELPQSVKVGHAGPAHRAVPARGIGRIVEARFSMTERWRTWVGSTARSQR